jgi:hypothetical protein
MQHAVMDWLIARRASGTKREQVNWCHGKTGASMSKVPVEK